MQARPARHPPRQGRTSRLPVRSSRAGACELAKAKCAGPAAKKLVGDLRVRVGSPPGPSGRVVPEPEPIHTRGANAAHAPVSTSSGASTAATTGDADAASRPSPCLLRSPRPARATVGLSDSQPRREWPRTRRPDAPRCRSSPACPSRRPKAARYLDMSAQP